MDWKRLAPIIGIGIFVYVLWRIGLGQIWQAATSADARYFFLLPPAIAAALMIQTFKWNLILRKQNINIGIGATLMMHLVGFFYGSITPGRLGSLMKIIYLKNHSGKGLGQSSSSVIIDRFLDLVVVLCFAVIGSLILLKQFTALLPQMLLALVLLAALVAIFSNRRLNQIILKPAFHFLVPKRLKEETRQTFDDFYHSLPRPKYLIYPIILTVANWTILFTQMFVVALSLGIKVDYLAFIFLISIATVIGLIPITIGGLGTREATLIALFTPLGISPEKIVVMSLLCLIMCLYLPALVSAVFAFPATKTLVRTGHILDS